MIYKIRIILDAEEDIFRDIEIQDDVSVEDLHNAITQAFGFLGNEMASFYTCDEQWNQDEEIALFDMSENNSDLRLMDQVALNEVLNEFSPKLIYVYDFLSMWTFFVELADTTEKVDGQAYPNILFSYGAVPDSPPDKIFEAEENEFDFDNTLDNYEDLDFEENWN